MNTDEFTELAGRIEAVARVVLHAVAVLEERSIIDGPRFSAGLRQSVQTQPDSPAHLAVAQERLQELAENLDDARAVRQSRASPEKNHGSHRA